MTAISEPANSDDVPAAHVVRISPLRHTRLVTIRCPYCGRKHAHGWPYGQDVIGVRVAHCAPTRRRWRNPPTVAEVNPPVRSYRVLTPPIGEPTRG